MRKAIIAAYLPLILLSRAYVNCEIFSVHVKTFLSLIKFLEGWVRVQSKFPLAPSELRVILQACHIVKLEAIRHVERLIS